MLDKIPKGARLGKNKISKIHSIYIIKENIIYNKINYKIKECGIYGKEEVAYAKVTPKNIDVELATIKAIEEAKPIGININVNDIKKYLK